MYFSGTRFNFELRLHQTPNSGQDLVSFRSEAQNYKYLITSGETRRWNQEYWKRGYTITGSGQNIV